MMLLGSSMSFTGCSVYRSVISSVRGVDADQPQASEPAVEVSQSARQAPLELRIGNAFRDEKDLHVKVYVEPMYRLDPEDVVVSIAGLKEGEVIEEQHHRLSDVVSSSSVGPGQRVALRFTLPAENLSEYQVRCSWGADAQMMLAKLEQPQAVSPAVSESEIPQETALPEKGDPSEPEARAMLQKSPELLFADRLPPAPAQAAKKLLVTNTVSLEDVRVVQNEVPCDRKPCDVLYTVEAQLQNGLAFPLKSVEIGLGLYWVEDGATPTFPSGDSTLAANEELVTLDGLGLASGAQRTLRVSVDRQVPIVPGGAFMPHVRILSFRSEQAGKTDPN